MSVEESTWLAVARDTRRLGKPSVIEEEKGDTDTVASSHASERMMIDTNERAEFLAEDRCFRKLFRSSTTDDRSRRQSRRTRRRNRRKRGDSLERQISQLILGTAKLGTVDSSSDVVKSSNEKGGETTSVEFILQDLVHHNSTEQLSPVHPLDRSKDLSGTEKQVSNIQSKFSESQSHTLHNEGHLSHGDTIKEVDTNETDVGKLGLEKIVSHRSSTRDIFPDIDIHEYEDPSLEINFPDHLENDGDSTHREDEVTEPDEEHETISALSSNEFKVHTHHKEPVSVELFDSWVWRDPHAMTTPTMEKQPLTPGYISPSTNSQETPQSRKMVDVEYESTPVYEEQFRAREGQPTPVTSNKESRYQMVRHFKEQAKRTVKEEVIFKKNFEEWSPFMAMDFSCDDIRFSDTLVDPDEFERVGSVDEDGFLIKPPKQPVMKPLKLKSPLSYNGTTTEIRRQTSEKSASSRLGGDRQLDADKFGWLHPHSPDSVIDPSATFHFSSRRVDPPGAREMYFTDEINTPLPTRIAI